MDTILKERLMKAGTALLVVFAVYGAVLALSALKNYRYIGGGYGNVITVSGEGEVFAVADIAQFGFSVVAERATLTEAQDASAESINAIIAYLREAGIEERDIKTTNYSANPRYEYRDAAVSYPSTGGGMEPAIMPVWDGGDTRVLVGYEVRQNITVKVRDTDTVGDVVTGVGSRGATDIYGPDFTIDDSDELEREARELAIEDARNKARDLAKDLDVRLVRVVSFSENGGGYYPMYARSEMSMDSAGGGMAVAPELPAGENRVASHVTITYEIR